MELYFCPKFYDLYSIEVLATRLLTVIAGSYSYIIPVISIVQAKRYDLYTDPYEVNVIFLSLDATHCADFGLNG
ncbi:hypothetical protein S83_010770 [Arachis hypogaea]